MQIIAYIILILCGAYLSRQAAAFCGILSGKLAPADEWSPHFSIVISMIGIFHAIRILSAS